MEKIETFQNDDKGVDELLPQEERKRLLKQKFFEYCKKGDQYGILKIIDDELLNIEELDDKKWTGLQWAVVNGNTEIVKLLLEKMEDLKLKIVPASVDPKQKRVEDVKNYKKNEFDDIFKKPPIASAYGKYNPLHWAAYKGYPQIISILLRYGYNPLDIDNVGSTSIHQAAASNNMTAFKIFMGLGVDLEVKNDRGHMAIDLTAEDGIKNLIIKTLSIKFCQICTRQFDFFVKRYLCSINEEVICKNCCSSEFYYENVFSKDKDIIECRCKNCYNFILEKENQIQNAISSNNLEQIQEIYTTIKNENTKICSKIRKDAEFHIDRLGREEKIIAHINNLKVVENHKTIEKSVFLLEEMIKDATSHKIDLDINVIEKSFLEKNRLLAEKELRKVLSNLTVEQSSAENLQNLEEKLNNAKMCKVEDKYSLVAEDLRKKIQLNLQAKDLLELFLAYPIREYPKVEPVDPKKKNKKPDPPPKKKKKKEPPFIIPEWAKELRTLNEKVMELKGYVNDSTIIGLDENFLLKSKEQLSRFSQEIAFRKNEEDTLKRLEEEKKKKKKKK